MNAITLRAVPPDVARAIERLAKKEGLSLNRAVIRLLEQAVAGVRRPARRSRHDLDRFFGTWSRAEADAFDRLLEEQRWRVTAHR